MAKDEMDDILLHGIAPTGMSFSPFRSWSGWGQMFSPGIPLDDPVVHDDIPTRMINWYTHEADPSLLPEPIPTVMPCVDDDDMPALDI